MIKFKSSDSITSVKELSDASMIPYDLSSSSGIKGFKSVLKFNRSVTEGGWKGTLLEAHKDVCFTFIDKFKFLQNESLYSEVAIGEPHQRQFIISFDGHSETGLQKNKTKKQLLRKIVMSCTSEIEISSRKSESPTSSDTEAEDDMIKTSLIERMAEWIGTHEDFFKNWDITSSQIPSAYVCFCHPTLVSKECIKDVLLEICGEKDYERYEFLGDSVLSSYVTKIIFRSTDKLSPGQMTSIRQKLTSNEYLFSVAVSTGMNKMVEHLNKNQTPNSKVVSDVVEAFIGWMYCHNKGSLKLFLQSQIDVESFL